MLNWKIENYVFKGTLFSSSQNLSNIEDELYDYYDDKIKSFKLRKDLNFTTYFTVYINACDYSFYQYAIDFTNISHSIYLIEREEFKKIILFIRKKYEDTKSLNFDLLKEFFSSMSELDFISFLDENHIISKHVD